MAASWKKIITAADVAADNQASIADGQTGLVTGNAVYDYITAQNFGTGAGDIESVVVTADDTNTVGAATGSANFTLAGGTGINTSASASILTVALDYSGTDNFIDSATNLEGTAIATGDTIVYHDASDNNVKKGFVSDLPFTNNTGTVTSITGGSYLIGGTITSSGTLDVDAASANTANKVVARDASGNFAAGTITAALTGNADTATTATNVSAASVTTGTYYIGLVSGAGNVPVNYNAGFSWSAASNTLTVSNLVVVGTTTALTTTNLEVSDKVITLANVTTPTTSTAHQSGIQIESSAAEAEWPELKWNNNTQLTGWTLANHTATSSTDFPVSVMQFGSGAPSSPAIETEAGAGAFFADTNGGNLYIFI